MIVLGIDLETTGFVPGTDRITELGAVLWDTQEKTPLRLFCRTVQTSVELTPEIQRITGIKPHMVQAPHAIPIGQALYELHDLAEHADYYVAHNAPFDRSFIEHAAAHFQFPLKALPWIDTITDVPYPDSISTRRLGYLAAEHGFLIPFAHRALFDVMAMLKVLSLYDFAEVVKLQASPTLTIYGRHGYENNATAKEHGFKWDAESKQWFRNIKECHYTEGMFPFRVVLDKKER